jgi:uncharacterized RDD family membrane protein YckC
VETPVPGEGGQEPLPPPSLSPSSQPGRVDIPGGAGLSSGAGAPPPPPPGYTTQPPPPPPGYGAAQPSAYPPPPPAYPPYGAPGGGYGYPVPTDGPAPGLRYAGFGVRTGAYLIDAILLFVVALLFSPAFGGFLKDNLTVVNGELVNLRTVNPAVSLFNVLIGAIYFIGFWSASGRTLGMRALRLRVVRAADGHPITIGQAVIRYIGLLISFLVVLIGVIWVAIDPRKQGWHDKMAGSFVVQDVTTT